jgi:phosphoribosylglycinamide formyltransferase-1
MSLTTDEIYRFAFYVSGNASRLIKIIDIFPEIIERTKLVINDGIPNETLANLLLEKNVEYVEINYKGIGMKGDEKNIFISNFILQKFSENKIDYAFCFGSKLLKGELLNKYENKIINFHPSVLPSFPGIKAIDQAINSNAFLLGNTAHFIDDGIDTGPIIMQNIIHSSAFNDYEDVLSLQLPMIKQIFSWLNQNRISVKNNKVEIKNVSYDQKLFFPKLEN